jgi:hypothetical protein
MSVSLNHLPFDVLFHIASNLQLDDIVHLGQTCQQLQALLEESTLLRHVVEVCIARIHHFCNRLTFLQTQYQHTEETRLARLQEITYKQAFHAIYDRRHACSTAYPFSARIVGHGNTFLFRQGVLCVLNGSMVSVSRTQSESDTIQLDLNAITQPMFGLGSTSNEAINVSLLYYSDGILAVHASTDCRPNGGLLLALRTDFSHPEYGNVAWWVGLTSSSKLFVRHTAHYLYYGTHTGVGADEHHKWEIKGFSLDDPDLALNCAQPLLLEKFHGTDIGSTVAFEIFDGYFYAVSNQGTFEVEEVDWTSFYHCVRFPLENPVAAELESNERVFRRQHAQGPIHDSWTDLSLQLNESTKEILIVESRREWAQASSRQSRTFYVSEFGIGSDQCSGATSPSDTLLLPENDIFVDVLDSTNKPNYMPTPPQYSWSRHTEFAPDDPLPRSFILARTKFRGYSYSCTSFVDVVEDERCCNDPSKPPCIRLRVGSRRETCPEASSASSKGKGRLEATPPLFVDKAKYRNARIRMWPPPASKCPCSKRLHGILNPPLPNGTTHARTVAGVLDERTFVYMIKPGRSYGSGDDSTLGTIVLIDFTRPLQHDDSTQSGGVPMVQSDSKMKIDVDNKTDSTSDALSWVWSPGQEKRCRSGTCH